MVIQLMTLAKEDDSGHMAGTLMWIHRELVCVRIVCGPVDPIIGSHRTRLGLTSQFPALFVVM